MRIHVSGIDVVRDEDGEFRVLEDNIRCPSGVSYVLANRQAMARVLPEVFWGQAIQSVADYPARLLGALRRRPHRAGVRAHRGGAHPGRLQLGLLRARPAGPADGGHLVEGRDLVCHGTEVFLRTTEGEVPVHVIYRRIDDEYIDPLQFRPESLVGCPGLLNAARDGRVTVANAIGNGVADDKLVYTYVPDMIRYYLDEDPILANVETYRLFDDDVRREAPGPPHELVFKRVDGSGGKGLIVGPLATHDELDELAPRSTAAPRAWIAQGTVALSTSPTWVDGRMVPRHVDLRPFAVNDGEEVWVLPGGSPGWPSSKGGLVVNSSQGGGSKDTWVLGGTSPGGHRTRAPGPAAPRRQAGRPWTPGLRSTRARPAGPTAVTAGR